MDGKQIALQCDSKMCGKIIPGNRKVRYNEGRGLIYCSPRCSEFGKAVSSLGKAKIEYSDTVEISYEEALNLYKSKRLRQALRRS